MTEASETPQAPDEAADLRAEFLQLWGKLVAQSWEDSLLRQRLLDEPVAVLAEHGAEIPEDITVKVLEDTANTLYLPLPLGPDAGELSDKELDAVAGGRASSRTGKSIRFRGRDLTDKASPPIHWSVTVVAKGIRDGDIVVTSRRDKK